MDIQEKRERVKLVYVPRDAVMALFTAREERHEILCVPDLTNVPAGYEILGVDFSFSHNAFGFLVHHPTFERVTPGYLIPELVSAFEMKETRYRRTDLDNALVLRFKEGIDANEIAKLLQHTNGEVRVLDETVDYRWLGPIPGLPPRD